MKMFRKKGEAKVWLVAIVAVVCLTLAITLISNIGYTSCYTQLSRQGYVVLAAGEYTDIMALLNDISTKADAAVANASAAATLSQATINILKLHTENEVFLYPNVSSETVTFTAGVGADTFGAWAIINSSAGITLSSEFATHAGYLSEIMTHNYSVADNVYIIEIAYGGDKTVVGRVKIRSDWTYVLELNSVVIPVGTTVYYRMQCETGGATLSADFRYYFN